MRIVVHGGHPLQGTFRPSGNSNAAIALTAASLLTDQPVILSNVPDTLSTTRMFEMATVLGTQISRDRSRVQFQTPTLLSRSLAESWTEQVAAVLFLAPILARRRHARMETPFALNRLYTHLTALRDLGVKITANSGVIEFQAEPWERKELVLLQTSVTATALVCMLAASLGRETIVHNAASEPHIQDLQKLLVEMGAAIDGIGSNCLRITGSETLGGGALTLSPDHNEIASIAAIGAITHGSLTIEGVVAEHMRIIPRVFARLGVNLYLSDHSLFLPAHDQLEVSQRAEEQDVPIETAPWPGFPSDLVAITTVVATQARGSVLIHEKLYDNRLLFVDKLTSMGAQIVLCDPHRALVVGPSHLRGEYLDTPDVRTGLALLGAALCCREGAVTVDSAELIDRTFENVVSKLVDLGAKIEVLES